VNAILIKTLAIILSSAMHLQTSFLICASNFDLLVDKQSISMTYLVEKMIFLSFKIVGNQTYCEQVLTAKDTEKELIKIANELYKKYYISAVKHIHLTKRVLKNAQ
jgi:hypothetical protein